MEPLYRKSTMEPLYRKVTGVVRPSKTISAQMLLGNRVMTIHPTFLAVESNRELHWLGHLFIPGIFDGEYSFIIKPLSENQSLLFNMKSSMDCLRYSLVAYLKTLNEALKR